MSEGTPIPTSEKLKKLKGVSAIAGATALAVSACSSEPPFMDGTVENKVFEPERTWIWMMPITNCFSTGKTTSCTTSVIPMYMKDDADYIVRLKNCDQIKDNEKVCKSEDIYVSPAQYEQATIGEYVNFNGTDEATLEDPVEKTRKKE